MAKQIYLSPEAIEETLTSAIRKLKASLSGAGSTCHDKITVDVKTMVDETTYKDERATLVFTPIAWIKMSALVGTFSTEVQWHGLVTRQAKNKFLVEDILNFEHEVTGSTVVSDYEKQQEFWDSLPDDVFAKMKLHGHSHVNMATSPSKTDMDYRYNVLQNTGKPTEEYDEFQIFIIWNKRNEHEAQIYDLTNNILYESKDIDIVVDLGNDTTLQNFVEEAKRLTKTPASRKAEAAPANKAPVPVRTYHDYNAYGGYDRCYDYGGGYGGYSGRLSEDDDFWDDIGYGKKKGGGTPYKK